MPGPHAMQATDTRAETLSPATGQGIRREPHPTADEADERIPGAAASLGRGARAETHHRHIKAGLTFGVLFNESIVAGQYPGDLLREVLCALEKYVPSCTRYCLFASALPG